MRRLLSLVFVGLLCCGMTAAQYQVILGGNKPPTYYVSNAGSDSNSGLSPGSPWQTVAKVNAVTKCVPGTQFLFKRGGTWHEELIVPCSGASGKLISFDAYGSGASPILTGADVAGGGGWTQGTVTPLDTQDFSSGGLSGAFWTNSACTFPTSPVHGTSTHSMQCVGSQSISHTFNTNVVEYDAWFQISANTATNGQIARIFFNEGTGWNGANGVGVWVNLSGAQLQLSVGRGSAAGATKFNITQGTWYALRFITSSNSGNSTDFAQLYANGSLVSSLSSLSLTSPVNGTPRIGTNGAFNAASFTENFDDLLTYNQDSTTLANVWFSTLTTQPNVVLFNESQNRSTLGPQTSAAAVSSTNQWFWGSNVLTVASVGSPASTYTTPGVQAGTRAFVVIRNNKNYWAINNVIIEGSNSALSGPCAALCISRYSPDNTTPIGVNATGLEVRYNGWEGAWFGATNGVYSNSSFHDNLGMGVDFDTESGMTGTNLTSNTNLYGSYPGAVSGIINNLTLVNFSASGNAQNGLTLSLGANYTILACSLNSNTFNGLLLDGTAVAGATISGCTAHNNGDAGFRVSGAASETNIALQSNLSYANTNYGFYIGGGTPSTSLLNNVSQGNGTGILLTGANTAVISKNNITYNNTIEAQVDASVNGALTLNFNDYFHNAGGNFLTWHGVAGTFSTWKSSSSQDANSISTDPLFTSVPSDFTLQGGSPAIAAGTPLTPNINTFTGVPFANPPSMGAYGP